jgi:hypothetical protein
MNKTFLNPKFASNLNKNESNLYFSSICFNYNEFM